MASGLDERVRPEELDTCISVLSVLAENCEEYHSEAHRELRKRLQPLIQRLARGASRDDAVIKQHHKALKLRSKQEQQQEANQDRKFIANTKLRAARMAGLQQVVAANYDAQDTQERGQGEVGKKQLLVLDGAVEDDCTMEGVVVSATQPAFPPQQLNERRACYICKGRYRDLHHFYDALCPMCATLNFHKRHQTASLTGKVAVVTGARVKIGFHAALKLLRAGCSVVATSRFPYDTAQRYAKVSDFADFSARLHVYGLDFRDLRSVELFAAHLLDSFGHVDVLVNNACQTIRRPRQYYTPLLKKERDAGEQASPDIKRLLANNNAFVHGEGNTHFLGQGEERNLLEDSGGVAEPRGGPSFTAPSAAAVMATTEALSAAPALPSLAAELSQMQVTSEDMLSAEEAGAVLPQGAVDVNEQQLDLRKVNTWVKRGHEVETPEVAEVFAINSIAPFVLCSKLRRGMTRAPRTAVTDMSLEQQAQAQKLAELPDDCTSLAEAMLVAGAAGGAATGHQRGDFSDRSKNSKTSKASSAGIGAGASSSTASCVHGAYAPPRLASETSFIVNVSAMEGKFYRKKTPNHPHTNMAKAALNMMTRTSSDDYAADGIFMTCVDTGWINDENPLDRAAATAARQGFATPLDEIDAAARILDPVFTALSCAEDHGGLCRPVYGAFLKDYYASEW